MSLGIGTGKKTKERGYPHPWTGSQVSLWLPLVLSGTSVSAGGTLSAYKVCVLLMRCVLPQLGPGRP